MTKEQLKEQFWANHKNIKRKTVPAQKLAAEKEQLIFAKQELSKLSDVEINEMFGGFADFVRKWINAELVCNKFGRHMYVKLG